MIFYFNSNGTLVEMLPQEVYQGSNKVSTIYFIGPFPSTSQVTARLRLANGDVMPTQLLRVSSNNAVNLYGSGGVGLTIWEGSLDFYATKICGNVMVQFAITSSTDTTTTETVAFLVKRGVRQNANVGVSDENLLNELLSRFSALEGSMGISGQEKVDKVSGQTMLKQAYIKQADGTQAMLNIDTNTNSAIVLRKANGNITAGTPTEATDATPKSYVDSLLSNPSQGSSLGGKRRYTLVEKVVVGYSTLLIEPNDWSTNYTDYFINSGTRINPEYVHVSGAVAPTFEAGMYFSYNANGVSSISRKFETNGTPYNYDGLLFMYELKGATSTANIYTYITEGSASNYSFYYFFNNSLLSQTSQWTYATNEIIGYDGLYQVDIGSKTVGGVYSLGKDLHRAYLRRSNESIANNYKLCDVYILGVGGVNIPGNSIIYIYKVEI